MPIPLLGLLGGMGLLGAGRYAKDKYEDSRVQQQGAERQARIESLLGAPKTAYQMPDEQMFPGEEPIQGLYSGGGGLLGSIDDPRTLEVAKFYGGLLTTPGYEQMGAQGINSLMAPGAQGSPAAVREWEYYNQLPEEQKSAYLTMKRAAPTFTMGDVPMIGDQVTRTAMPFTEKPGQTQAGVQATLSGQDAAKKAMEENVKNASKLSDEYFGRLDKVKLAINNYDEALDLISKGADTGVIASRLPSIQQTSIALDNLQGRMGLDVIGNTTFGALSESELKFALDTALPKKLDGPALTEWLTKKKAAQQKLAAYLEQAATFLGTPGNTQAMWIKEQKRMAAQKQKPQGGAPSSGGWGITKL